MHFSSHGRSTSVRSSESELGRLTQTQLECEERLAAARTELGEATTVRQVLLIDGESMLKDRAIAAADGRVKIAEGVVRKFEEALAGICHDRELAQQRVEAARDEARRLDEAASVALVICEIVDALKAFERASDRLASALAGSRGKAAHTAPFVAASLRISTTSLATEGRAVLNEVDAYRAGLLDGSVKLDARPSSIGSDCVQPHQFLAAEPTLSIVPPPIPSVAPAPYRMRSGTIA
jgi:hypothetical protein